MTEIASAKWIRLWPAALLLAAGCSSAHEGAGAPTTTAATSTSTTTSSTLATSGPSATGPTAPTTGSRAAPSPPGTQPGNTRGQTSPSGVTTCTAGQLQVVLSPSQGAGGGTIAATVTIRNTGPLCTMEGFPTAEFLNAAGGTLPSYVARSGDSPAMVTLPANQPPFSPSGGVAYVYFLLLGTNMTADNKPCPRQEQGAVLRITLPGGAAYTVNDVGPFNSTFSSCDGRIQVGPIRV